MPIDRVREARDAPKVYEGPRKALTEKLARLEQTHDLAEGEKRPETRRPDNAAPVTGRVPADEDASPDRSRRG